MADVFSKKKRSQVMATILGRGNKATELVLVNLLRLHKLTGWRRHVPLPGKPDFAFRQQRLAVFVDGCFWHGCVKHCRMPASNVAFWQRKISRNRSRHKLVAAMLRQRGWRVVRVWEHELRKPARVLARIRKALAVL